MENLKEFFKSVLEEFPQAVVMREFNGVLISELLFDATEQIPAYDDSSHFHEKLKQALRCCTSELELYFLFRQVGRKIRENVDKLSEIVGREDIDEYIDTTVLHQIIPVTNSDETFHLLMNIKWIENFETIADFGYRVAYLRDRLYNYSRFRKDYSEATWRILAENITAEQFIKSLGEEFDELLLCECIYSLDNAVEMAQEIFDRGLLNHENDGRVLFDSDGIYNLNADTPKSDPISTQSMFKKIQEHRTTILAHPVQINCPLIQESQIFNFRDAGITESDQVEEIHTILCGEVQDIETIPSGLNKKSGTILSNAEIVHEVVSIEKVQEITTVTFAEFQHCWENVHHTSRESAPCLPSRIVDIAKICASQLIKKRRSQVIQERTKLSNALVLTQLYSAAENKCTQLLEDEPLGKLKIEVVSVTVLGPRQIPRPPDESLKVVFKIRPPREKPPWRATIREELLPPLGLTREHHRGILKLQQSDETKIL